MCKFNNLLSTWFWARILSRHSLIFELENCRNLMCSWILITGDYSAEKLLQMVALHLDATYAECNMWKEFASCFLKLSLSEEDRISTCFAGNGETLQGQSKNFNRKPVIVAESVMGKEWILRCRWWQTRHFSQSILVSEFEAGISSHLIF